MITNSIRKTVIINRAVPGSGKTTISNRVLDYLLQKRVSVAIHSTDDFFISNDGKYNFNIDYLHRNHLENLSNFMKSLKMGVQVVICDNINLCPWQTEPYTNAAREQDYYIIFITFEPRELEKHVLSQMPSHEKPDAHGVSEEVLIRFIEEYKDYSTLLDTASQINPDIHRHYCWDDTTCQRIESNVPANYFDFDSLITILPCEYHRVKEEIGEKIFSWIATTSRSIA